MSVSTTIIFDTYAWIEYFTGSENGKHVAKYVTNDGEIGVSSLCLAEIKVKYEREGRPADERLQFIRLRSVILPVTEEIALQAAEHRLKNRLPMMDAVMYATAVLHKAKLLTGDKHFQGLPEAEFLA